MASLHIKLQFVYELHQTINMYHNKANNPDFVLIIWKYFNKIFATAIHINSHQYITLLKDDIYTLSVTWQMVYFISAPELCISFESTYHIDRGNILWECQMLMLTNTSWVLL